MCWAMFYALEKDNGVPQLKLKKSNSLSLEDCDKGIFSIGVESTHYSRFTHEFVELKAQTLDFASWTVEHISLAVTSILQAYGLWNYTMPDGIGGLFTGLYSNKDGVRWQPTLAYVLFEVNFDSLHNLSDEPEGILPSNLFTNPTFVFVTEKENLIYVSSPKPNYSGFLFRSYELRDEEYVQSWFSKYSDELIDKFLRIDAEYFIFISINTKVISMFYKDELLRRNVRLEKEEQLTIRFDFSTLQWSGFLWESYS